MTRTDAIIAAKNVLDSLSIKYVFNVGSDLCLMVERDSMVAKFSSKGEEGAYTETIKVLKDNNPERYFWISKNDDYLFLDVIIPKG